METGHEHNLRYLHRREEAGWGTTYALVTHIGVLGSSTASRSWVWAMLRGDDERIHRSDQNRI